MQRARFRRLVAAALESIPLALAARMDNVDVQVQMRPTAEQLESAGIDRGHLLLGLYQGHPLITRSWGYGNTLPDRILIFQEAIEAVCDSEEEIVEQVQETVIHEVAHHFGIDDDRLDDLGMG